MVVRNSVISLLATVVFVFGLGCGSDGNTPANDNGMVDAADNSATDSNNPSDSAIDSANPDSDDDAVDPDGQTGDIESDAPSTDANDAGTDVMPACPPWKCIDDGQGNLIENPNMGCVGELCAAGPMSDPDPTAFGPYPVGIKHFVFFDPNPENANTDVDGNYLSDREMKVDVWFPTTEEFRTGEKYVYDIKADCNDKVKQKFGDVEIGKFPVEAVMDAPIRHGEGRYPVVIFSHGAYGIRFQSIFFTIQLASHGYIVIATDHQFNTLNEILVDGWNGADLIPAAMHRPRDIFALLDWIQAKDADPADDFFALVDMGNVACTGHSFGGLTSYVAVADPRIKAIVPMAPAADMANALAGIFNQPYIEEMVIPTLVMGGEMDKTLQYQSQQRDWFDIQPPPKWMLSMPRAGHYTFTDVCMMNLEGLVDYWGDADDALRDGCGVDNFDSAQAHKAINLYAISFLNHFLRHSPAAAERLVQTSAAEFGEDVEFLAFPATE